MDKQKLKEELEKGKEQAKRADNFSQKVALSGFRKSFIKSK